MSQTQSNFPTKTGRKTTYLRPQAANSLPADQKMYKARAIATRDAAKMAAYAPAEVGTRGTVGSLIMREIEYFNQLELRSECCTHKPPPPITSIVSSSSHLRTTFDSMAKTRKKKKRGTGLLPSICSMVDVADNNRPIGISVYSYRNLRSDVKKLPG